MEVDCSNKRSRVHHKCYKNTVPGRWYITSATRTLYLGAGTSQVLQEHCTWALVHHRTRPLVHHKCYKNTVPGRWYITVPGRWYITSATRTLYLIPIKEYMSNFKVKKYIDPNKIVVRATVANDCIVRIELTTLDSCNIYQLYRLFEKQGLN